MSARSFHRDGQRGWAHDEGHAAGTFETYDALDLGYLGPRKVHVFLPRHRAARCPVVYMHDGDTAFWPGGVARGTWDVAGTLSALQGRVEPLIVVAVHPLRRDFEYTHIDWRGGREPWGDLPRYARWLAERVKPWIDAQYPTDPGRASVVGSSHGGLASFWTATRHPGAFGAAGCLSPSFFSGLDDLGTGDSREVTLASSSLVADVAPLLRDPARRPRLWICWGTRRDGGAHNAIVEALAARRGREMVDLLRDGFGYQEGRELWVREDRGAGHDEPAWRRRFGELALALHGLG